MRSQVWDLPTTDSSFWDGYVPDEMSNALLFANTGASEQACWISLYEECTNSCSTAMGFDDKTSEAWSYSMFGYKLFEVNSTQIPLVSVTPKAQYGNMNSTLKYCLAEPLYTTCQIGLAKSLLLGVSAWYAKLYSSIFSYYNP